MRLLICFYKDNQYIYTQNYSLFVKSRAESAEAFFKKIESQYFNQIKIVQIDFNQNIDLAEIYVYVVHSFEIKSKNEFQSAETKSNLSLRPSLSKNDFLAKIDQIKKDIARGRYYQVNLTSRYFGTTNFKSFDLFNYYFFEYNGAYSALIPRHTDDIICFSPELFLKKTGSELFTQPIKGTAVQKNSLDSTKEISELSMIVDLLRNDLNSIPSNVQQSKALVTKHRELMRLGYVDHTYSEIKILTDKKISDILMCTFPGGSISGCPKIESLKAIQELEDAPRGFYTGSIGWWEKDDFCLNIAIRSFLKELNSSQITYFAGCGIVYDSQPEDEWLEFLKKAGKVHINYE